MDRETLRVLFWILFVILLFTPMIAESVFASDILPIAQRVFPFWKNKPYTVFLSDVLFLEAGGVIFFWGTNFWGNSLQFLGCFGC
jgi:hypothetical protein